jgi:hypothetical protein
VLHDLVPSHCQSKTLVTDDHDQLRSWAILMIALVARSAGAGAAPGNVWELCEGCAWAAALEPTDASQPSSKTLKEFPALKQEVLRFN